jgi:IS5 family transposase
LFESVLPELLLRLPDGLARVDVLLDDPAFFAPFVPYFDPRIGRPSTPVETYLRLMFLKFWYRLGYESLCREVADSITWRRFCRIPLEGAVPHPTTLMKLSTRCGAAAVEGLNEALLAKAAEAKLLRTNRIRVDTTVVPGNVAYPTDSGLLAKAVRRIAVAGRRIQAAGGATRTKIRDRSRAAGKRGSPDRQGPAGQAVEFGHKAQVVDNADGVVLEHTVEQGNPADAPQLAPAVERVIKRTGRTPRTVTADRGYGEKKVEDDLHDLGVQHVVISPAEANPRKPDGRSNTDRRSDAP